MLKELADELTPAVTALFNQSLQSGELPKDWLESTVLPIFKKGSRKIAANYRPVSLTSILCKILEQRLREVVLQHLQAHHLLSKKQFGFLGGRSTVLQLLTFLDYCVAAMARGNVVDSVYLDFQKAFDMVPHKLSGYGIENNVLNWIKDLGPTLFILH